MDGETLVRIVLRGGQQFDVSSRFTDADGAEADVRDQYGVGMSRLFRAGQRVSMRTATGTVVICTDEIAAVEITDARAVRPSGEVMPMASRRPVAAAG